MQVNMTDLMMQTTSIVVQCHILYICTHVSFLHVCFIYFSFNSLLLSNDLIYQEENAQGYSVQIFSYRFST